LTPNALKIRWKLAAGVGREKNHNWGELGVGRGGAFSGEKRLHTTGERKWGFGAEDPVRRIELRSLTTDRDPI
jgi:hypothetical protein